MILLNGVPPIVGLGLFHVTLINMWAIWFEYNYLYKRLNLKYLLIRTLSANLFSLITGIIVMVAINNHLPGDFFRIGMDFYSANDKFSMFPSLLGLVAVNAIIEIPFYLIRNKVQNKEAIKHVLIANLKTNLPIIILYSLMAL